MKYAYQSPKWSLTDENHQAHLLAIMAARDAGVAHIFYTSLAFGGDGMNRSAAHVMQAHLQTEEVLRAWSLDKVKKFSFTAIREGIYSESFPMYTGFPDLANPSEVVKIPHDGTGPGVAWVKIEDLGEATAKLVQKYATADGDDEEYKNKIVLLSGSKAYNLAETVQVLANVTGRDIEIKSVTVEDYTQLPIVQQQLGSHGTGDVPKKWVTSFEAIQKGETAVTSANIEKLLGRSPEPFETTVARMVKEARPS